MSVEERLAEILERYGPDDPVHRAITKARVDLCHERYKIVYNALTACAWRDSNPQPSDP